MNNKNNMKRLAAISLAVMGIMLVFALFDAVRMNREIKELQKTVNYTQLFEDMLFPNMATAETGETAGTAESAAVADFAPVMNFEAGEEGVQLSQESYLPLTLSDAKVFVPCVDIEEPCTVAYRSEDSTAQAGAYRLALVKGDANNSIGEFQSGAETFLAGARNVSDDVYLTVAVALDEEHRSEQVDAIKKLLSDTVISDVTPKATLFDETVADDVSLEISDSYVQLQKGTDTVLVSAFQQSIDTSLLSKSLTLPNGLTLYGFITEDSKAISKTSPIWPDFPDDAMDASLVELYIVNYLNYLSGGTWTPDSDPSRFCKGLDKDHLPAAKHIPACTEDEIYRYLVQSVTNKALLSPDEQNTVKMLLSDSGEEFLDKVMSLVKDKDIPCKENLALYVSYIIHRPDWKSQKCFLDFKSATDVLRLAAAMSRQDVSLAKAPRFRSFTRAERRELLGLLEHVEKDEGFALRPEQFKRLGEKLHPGEYAKYFPESKAIFDKVRNGIKIETYNSKLQELMKPPVNAELLTAHLMLRPGMFARYLDFALRSCKDATAMEDVLFRFISVCKNVEPRVLVQLINHFRNRNNPVQLATGKANGAASKVLDREVEPIPEDICNRVARDIFNQLWQVLRAEDTEPKCVYLDPACHCNDIVFPDNPRQISSSLRSAACGSRTRLPEGNVLRAFLYWKASFEAEAWDGVDLDLSVAFYGDEKVNFVFYGNPKAEPLGAIHSGDRRCSGKNGAVEYVDFNIKKCLQNGIRYAAMVVNSYSGEKFFEMDAAFCGVMVRDGLTGEQFEPATVKDRFALTTESGQLVMVVVDLQKRELIMVDRTVAGSLAYSNVITDYQPTKDVCQYAMQLKSLSIKEMVGMRYAKFLKDGEWEKADVIISDAPEKFKTPASDKPVPRIVSPYDIPGIYDVVFGNSKAD